MSIVAAVKVYDGIVLGADSATIISGAISLGQVQVVKSYQNAQKIFQIDNFKIGVLTYGLGNIGNRSIASIISEFNNEIVPEKKITSDTSVQEVAQSLLDFVKIKYDEAFKLIPKNQPPEILTQLTLGFFVAGFSTKDKIAQEWEFMIPADTQVKRVREENAFGASWRGQSVPFTRIYMGFDPRLLDELIKKYNLNAQEVGNIVSKFQSSMQYNGMPLQDAVDFLNHILLTTINMSKFEIGTPTCSEPIDISVITHKEYKNIKYKPLNFQNNEYLK